MRVVAWLFKAASATLALAALLAGAAFFLFYGSAEDFSADLALAKRAARLELFNRGYIHKLDQDDIRYIYQSRCYRQCHGEAAMITAVLSPAGWIQVVERMRVKENVEITGREADVIIRYLEETYPTATSAYSYEVRKQTHHAVWRNDMGDGDIYGDVIYATPEYLSSIGAEGLIDEYDVNNHHVFIVSFTVHEGEAPMYDMDKISRLRFPGRTLEPKRPWILRFQTADKHHYETVVRFGRRGVNGYEPKAGEWFELALAGVGGDRERTYRWEAPIRYPKEVVAKTQNREFN